MYRRYRIITEFKALGFISLVSFLNVCKSIDPCLNRFVLIQFYVGKFYSESLCVELFNVLEKLKIE